MEKMEPINKTWQVELEKLLDPLKDSFKKKRLIDSIVSELKQFFAAELLNQNKRLNQYFEKKMNEAIEYERQKLREECTQKTMRTTADEIFSYFRNSRQSTEVKLLVKKLNELVNPEENKGRGDLSDLLNRF